MLIQDTPRERVRKLKRSKVMMEDEERECFDERVFANIALQRKLTCIEVPVIVDNHDRAITCLGGINAISKAQFNGGGLEMMFRPEDRYCRPTIAREEKTTNLVLRVRRRRLQSAEGYEYSTELLGVANKTFHFPGMVDYQVLPPGLNNASLQNSHSSEPSDYQFSEPLDDELIDHDVPTFFPPTSFTKFDRPFNYLTPKVTEEAGASAEATPTAKSRPKRVHNIYGFMVNYKGELPVEPHPQAYGLPYVEHPKIRELKELFKERPLWSRTALQYKVKLPQTFLRCLLSVLCYKFLSNPYKNLWVVLGYDPRVDPASKVHQSIDYRVPMDVMALVPVGRKTGNRGLSTTATTVTRGDSDEGELSMEYPDKDTPSLENKDMPLVETKDTPPVEYPNKDTSSVEEATFIFYPDRFPAQRQVIYQLCDIHDPEVQELIHSNDGEEQFQEPNGWCVPNSYDKIRKIINGRLRDLAQQTGKAVKTTERKEQSKTSKSKQTKKKK